MPYPASLPDPPAIVSPRLSVSPNLSASLRPSQDVASPAHPAVSASPLPPAQPHVAKRVSVAAKPESSPPEASPTRLTTFVKESAKPHAALLGPAVTLGVDAEPNPVSPDFFSPDTTSRSSNSGVSPDLSDGAFVSQFVHRLTDSATRAEPVASRRSYNLQLVHAQKTAGQTAVSISKVQGLLPPSTSADRSTDAQLVITQVGGSPAPPGVAPFPPLPDSLQDLPDSTRSISDPAATDETPPPPPDGSEVVREPHTIPSDELPGLEGVSTATPTAKKPTPAKPIATGPVPDVIELTADRQDYDSNHQVFTAEGNVVMRFRGAIMDADRLQVNLVNRIAVAEGRVALTRGEQVIRGERFEYNFVQETGTVFNASGEVFLPSAGADFTPTLPTDITAGAVPARPVSDRITSQQPTQGVNSQGGFTGIVGSRRNVSNVPIGKPGGSVNRLRFQADRIDFTPRQWFATGVRITNDPFSPPELELRADSATVTRLSPLRDEIRARHPRLVFDQGFSLPLLRSRVILDRRERDPALFRFGYDDEDRGGVFVQTTFEPIATENVSFSISPQFFIQQAVQDGKFFSLSNLGVKSRLSVSFSALTSLRASAVLTSLDPDEIEEELRASVGLQQLIPTSFGTHSLRLQYSYRDRIFNGSLGFQTVRESLGIIFQSPVIPLGKSGINFSYQANLQRIRSDTDRIDLLNPIRFNNRVSLTRFQASAALNRGFLLWRGNPLPATANEGLRFTPNPVVPFISLNTGVSALFSTYSNGDEQSVLAGAIGITGQFGHFSRNFLDYTGFNVTYAQLLQDGSSPFLFDRVVDTKVLSFGVLQQIYGPIRFGVQTSINLDDGQRISTDFLLEYSRRTYSVVFRFNPVLQIGSLSLKINDFNWNGGTEPFDGAEIHAVEGGVQRND
ncbi:MAG: DUF3769 domain-containing protein [Scytolyngbya sp. HA4215-MV1]|nr:DUF3769 domain-containing protein [Scytolyngbya sp. HA4215-MV1]